MFSRKKFRIKAGKHTRKLTGGDKGIAKILSTAFKVAKEKWNDGVKLTKEENPNGAKLTDALIAHSVASARARAGTNKDKIKDLRPIAMALTSLTVLENAKV